MNRIIRLEGGWRKEVHRQGDKVIAWVKRRSISKARLRRALRLEEENGGRKLIKLEERGNEYYIEQKFCPGEVKWNWGEAESKAIGKKLKELQGKKIFHMDIKPGNVLWEGGEIKAIIDFEEARMDREWRIFDLANTLSWVLVSGGSREAFWSGYGRNLEGDRMRKVLEKYLKRRMKENNPQTFLILAKERLERYKREVKERIIKIEDLREFRRRNKRKKIVFAVGAMELLHWGHLVFLEKIKKMGDLLVIGISSEASRKRIKGTVYSIIGQETRAETLGHFGDTVDRVVIVEGDDIRRPLEELRPEVLIVTQKDIQRGSRRPEEMELAKKLGGRVVVVGHSFPRVSSSEMIEKVARRKIEQVLTGGSRSEPILKPKEKLVESKIIRMADLGKWGRKWRKEGKQVVFTSLSADLFHVGHARFIQKAKSLGEVLVVGIPNNRSIAQLKGPGRPIVDEMARAMVVAKLPYVDKAVIFPEKTILECLKRLRPGVFFTVKEDWNGGLLDSPEAELMKSIGGKIVRSERQAPYISASKMIDKAAGELIREKFKEVLKTAQENLLINADFDPFAPASQLAARERGFYGEVLKEVEKSGRCVFCDLKEKYLIREKSGVVLTVALYPYVDGHLLVIPRRHMESMKDLNEEEWKTIRELIREGEELLKKKLGVGNYWVLIREGDGIAAGKTVRHLHFHLMPYDMKVIRMAETKLNILPIDLAKELRGE